MRVFGRVSLSLTSLPSFLRMHTQHTSGCAPPNICRVFTRAPHTHNLVPCSLVNGSGRVASIPVPQATKESKHLRMHDTTQSPCHSLRPLITRIRISSCPTLSSMSRIWIAAVLTSSSSHLATMQLTLTAMQRTGTHQHDTTHDYIPCSPFVTRLPVQHYVWP
jgi:hypothetical protein